MRRPKLGQEEHPACTKDRFVLASCDIMRAKETAPARAMKPRDTRLLWIVCWKTSWSYLPGKDAGRNRERVDHCATTWLMISDDCSRCNYRCQGERECAAPGHTIHVL